MTTINELSKTLFNSLKTLIERSHKKGKLIGKQGKIAGKVPPFNKITRGDLAALRADAKDIEKK